MRITTTSLYGGSAAQHRSTPTIGRLARSASGSTLPDPSPAARALAMGAKPGDIGWVPTESKERPAASSAWRPAGVRKDIPPRLHRTAPSLRPPPPRPDASEAELEHEVSRSATLLKAAQEELREERRRAAAREREVKQALVAEFDAGRAAEREKAAAAIARAREAAVLAATDADSETRAAKAEERGRLAEKLTKQRLALEEELNHATARSRRQEEQQAAAEEQRQRAEAALRAELEDTRCAKAQADELVKSLAAKLELTREGRIDRLRQQALRRMIRSELAYAWTSWHEMWEEVHWKAELLRRAVATLRVPRLGVAFRTWADHYAARGPTLREREAAEAEAAEEEREAAVAAMREGCLARPPPAARTHTTPPGSSRTGCSLPQHSYEARLAAAAEESAAMRSQIESMGAELEAVRRAAEAEAAAEREMRIDQLHRVAGRRIKNTALFRGWEAWLEVYRAEAWRERCGRLLRRAGAMVRRPLLARRFYHWLDRWDAGHRRAADRSTHDLQSRLDEARRGLVDCQEELGAARLRVSELEQSLALARVALADERKAVGKLRDALGQEKLVRVAAPDTRGIEAKRREAEAAAKAAAERERQAQALLEQYKQEAKRAAEQQKAKAEAELQRLLSEQRRELDADLAKLEKKLGRAEARGAAAAPVMERAHSKPTATREFELQTDARAADRVRRRAAAKVAWGGARMSISAGAVEGLPASPALTAGGSGLSSSFSTDLFSPANLAKQARLSRSAEAGGGGGGGSEGSSSVGRWSPQASTGTNSPGKFEASLDRIMDEEP